MPLDLERSIEVVVDLDQMRTVVRRDPAVRARICDADVCVAIEVAVDQQLSLNTPPPPNGGFAPVVIRPRTRSEEDRGARDSDYEADRSYPCPLATSGHELRHLTA